MNLLIQIFAAGQSIVLLQYKPTYQRDSVVSPYSVIPLGTSVSKRAVFSKEQIADSLRLFKDGTLSVFSWFLSSNGSHDCFHVWAYTESSTKGSDVDSTIGDGLSSSKDEDSAGLPPSGVVASAELDSELRAMLAQAVMSIAMQFCQHCRGYCPAFLCSTEAD